jgi:hypothetical protein
LNEKDVKDIKRILKNTHLIKTDSEIDDVFGEIASSINTTGVGI